MKSKHGFETTPKRSELMRRIKGKNTKAEIMLRKALWAAGVRYRINVAKLCGKPDLVISRYNLVVFVDGEFWHGYKWTEKKTRIRSNRDYWIKKIEGNMRRDRQNRRKLRAQGFTVVRFWEHEVKRDVNRCVKSVLEIIDKNKI